MSNPATKAGADTPVAARDSSPVTTDATIATNRTDTANTSPTTDAASATTDTTTTSTPTPTDTTTTSNPTDAAPATTNAANTATAKLLAMQRRYDRTIDQAKPTRLRVLSIEGSDPIGGAGTMADMKAFTAQGVYGYAAMTSVLAQNTRGVTDIVNVEPSFLLAQLNAVSDDAGIDAMKIGMLGTPELVGVVREWLTGLLRDYRAAGKPRPTVVLDPVMYAKSGDRLLTAEAERALATLVPLADIITPNAMELAALAAMAEAVAPVDPANHGAHDGNGHEASATDTDTDTVTVTVTVTDATVPSTTSPSEPASLCAPDSYQEMEGMARSVAARFGVAVYAKGGALALRGNSECTDILAVPTTAGTTDSSDGMAKDIPATSGTGVVEGEEHHDESARHTKSASSPATTGPAATAGNDDRGHENPRSTTTMATDSAATGRAPAVTVTRIEGASVPTHNVHGTGDTLSSTLAALRPQCDGWAETARRAKAWMNGAIAAADGLRVGHGHGPVDFTWRHSPTGLSFTEDYWRRTAGIRGRIATMPFLEAMLDGTLPLDDFSYYLHQDDLYLTDYTSLLALASSRAADPHERAFFADAASYGLEEGLTFHRRWYRGHGFTVGREPMSATTAAYLGHEHRFTDTGSYRALVAVVMPCYWVYSFVGQQMRRQVRERGLDLQRHPYGMWIGMYADPGFASRTLEELRICDRLAASATMADYRRMMDAALGSTEHEYRFFGQALNRDNR
ncbi:bifunctional hydroxymethylpyrimidine kinase/phosphomethylpyrimidine kinase [Bifidobacterium sp. ESL0763]|uniref:bifunctional hydroxymethylpyrimidine kinase/phosphomethylpyrimidine kinase n=1 Tax=Bifidobacterium sp. ESL0763 TaxID=2983227 RepID=UPI0023F6A8B8|nr:bifunctional hydroxymethylpyrimidine kinase/phosphomethylpyrimidine kinase [Bifidobacterium sp. ESL0763]MDF7664222.1 bifunctional hydroxymethylpyrimidine kinase/phosphomethylpyrimidine kinase [Bifidobacterium sp. ESL0763]